MNANQANPPAYRQVYVVLNPVAGNSQPGELQEAITTLFTEMGWEHEIYLTTGAAEEDVAALSRAACARGADLVVAAGGDGTVFGVVNGLVGSQARLGIVPVGTGNGLARVMGLPLAPQDAARLLTRPHTTRCIDLMQVDQTYFTLNVSAGISSRAMGATPAEDKQRFGVLAYAATIVRDAVQNEPSLFRLTLDGHTLQVRASEVLVSNGAITYEPPYLLGSADTFADGRLSVGILLANKPGDYLRLAWDLLVNPQGKKEELRDLDVRRQIVIEVEDGPQPLQGDGEVVGQTPATVSLVPQALEIVVPAA